MMSTHFLKGMISPYVLKGNSNPDDEVLQVHCVVARIKKGNNKNKAFMVALGQNIDERVLGKTMHIIKTLQLADIQ